MPATSRTTFIRFTVLEDRRCSRRATGGLGFATVEVIRRQGARVVATGRSEKGLVNLSALGAETLRLDLFDPEAPSALRASVDKRFGGRLDGLSLPQARSDRSVRRGALTSRPWRTSSGSTRLPGWR